VSRKDIGECFDGCACGSARRIRRRGIAGPSKLLRDEISARVTGKSVLEIGCGVGGLTFELLKAGAARATGIDMSPVSIQMAGQLSQEMGLSDRAEFAVGDGSNHAVEVHDVLVLDKVVCCFPDPQALLSNALRSHPSVFGMVLPQSTRIGGVAFNVGRLFINVFMRLRGRQFRVFVHDVDSIERALASAGLTPVVRRRKFPWLVGVYEGAGG